MKKHRGEYPCPIIQIHGWMSSPELEWLYQQAKLHQYIVEIGSAFGRSSHALLSGNYEAFQGTGKVYCVDCWPVHVKGTKTEFDYSKKDVARRLEFFRNVGHFPNLDIWEMTSGSAATFIRTLKGWESLGMVFLDGGTDQMEFDIYLWTSIGAPLLCGHDYSPEEYPNVVEVVDRLLPDRKIVPDTTIWYVER